MPSSETMPPSRKKWYQLDDSNLNTKHQQQEAGEIGAKDGSGGVLLALDINADEPTLLYGPQ